MKISIKLKCVFLLLIIPIVGFLAFSFLAQKTFEKDKLAYVYSSSELQAQALTAKTLSILNYWKLTQEIALTDVNWPKKTFSLASQHLLESKSNLVGIVAIKRSPSQDEIYVEYFLKDLDKKSRINYMGVLLKFLNQAWEKKKKFDFAAQDLSKNRFVIENQFKVEGSEEVLQIATLFDSPELVDSYFDKGMFTSLLVNNAGKVLFSGNENFEVLIKNSQLPRYFNSRISSGSVELTGEEKYLGAFSFLDQDIYVVTVTKQSQVMSALSIIKKQTTLFLVIAISACIILALIFSHKLTHAIGKLYDATLALSKGNYDISMGIKTNDEIEVLAFSFESMASKISQLLKELKKYNEHLEQLVAERTHELNVAMKMQKSILESLGQGFMIFNKEGTIQSVYSQAAVKMFNGEPDKRNYWSLITKNEEEKKECSELFNAAFDDVMPFDDVKTYAPQMYVNPAQQIIELDYHPIENESHLSSVIVVATDKTKEIESQKALEKERAHIKMIQKVLSQKHHFERFVGDFQKILFDTHKMVGSHRKDLLPTILRQLHTLKGNSSLYSLVEIKDKVHQVEMQVKEQMKGQNLDWTGLHKDLSDLTDLFEKFLKSNQQLLGLALDEEDSKVELSYPLLTKLYQKLQKFLPNDLSQEVSNEFFYIPAAEFIRAYPEYAEELAVRLDKKLAPMEIVGGDIKVKKNVYDDFFLSLIHLLRNSLDHGLETVAERQKSGKSPEGHIRFTVKHENNDLIVQFEDDGRGLDTKKILKDVQANDPETQKAALIKKLFYEGTSTKTEVTDISGQGAGLAAVGLIIDKLKGKIDIDFNRKVGASFIFRFPYV